MKFKKIFYVLLCSILFAHNSFALITANLTSNSSAINAGDSFILTLSITSTTEELLGLTYSLEVSANGSSLFSILGRNITGSVFNDPNIASPLPTAADALLNPSNTFDLGATRTGAGVAAPTGAFVANIDIDSELFTGIGLYTFFLTSNSLVTFGDNQLPDETAISANVIVNVIPEPTTFALLGLGSVLALGARRRRSSLK